MLNTKNTLKVSKATQVKVARELIELVNYGVS